MLRGVHVPLPKAVMARVAPHAHVSTRDKDQDPETQLYALRNYAAQRGWEIVVEYVDQASATDAGTYRLEGVTGTRPRRRD